jgi:hypothetical protein
MKVYKPMCPDDEYLWIISKDGYFFPILFRRMGKQNPINPVNPVWC